jgi:hypothetical protein
VLAPPVLAPPVLAPPVVAVAPPVLCPPVELLLPPVRPPVDWLLLRPPVVAGLPPVPELRTPPVVDCCAGTDTFCAPPLVLETPAEPTDPVAPVGLAAAASVPSRFATPATPVVPVPPVASGTGPALASAPAEFGLLASVGGSDEHPGIKRKNTSRFVPMKPRRMQISSMA